MFQPTNNHHLLWLFFGIFVIGMDTTSYWFDSKTYVYTQSKSILVHSFHIPTNIPNHQIVLRRLTQQKQHFLNFHSTRNIHECIKKRKVPTTAAKTLTYFIHSDRSNVRSGSSSVSLSSSLSSSMPSSSVTSSSDLSPFLSTITRIGMMLFIVSMCIALPVTLFPTALLYRLKLISRIRKERMALSTGCFCARWLLRFIPFVSIQCVVDDEETKTTSGTTGAAAAAVPSIWVCNHTSMLDVFLILASDHKFRKKNSRRPIKIVYWKTLENNPITKLLFTMSGFIPVAMAANAPGEDNQYDKSSFKLLLKECKRAFEEGFDVAVLPEGQLNPSPESGLLPVFTGAYTLAKMSRRPITVMALHNIHNMWHPLRGMICTSRRVKIRKYPSPRHYNSADEFKLAFETVVGHFGRTGEDHPDAFLYLQGKKNVPSHSTTNKTTDIANTTTSTTTTTTNSTSPSIVNNSS